MLSAYAHDGCQSGSLHEIFLCNALYLDSRVTVHAGAFLCHRSNKKGQLSSVKTLGGDNLVNKHLMKLLKLYIHNAQAEKKRGLR